VRPGRLFRTTSFRLTMLYVGLFGASVCVILLVTYWATAGALAQQLQGDIDSELRELQQDYRAGGLLRLQRTVENRLHSREPSDYFLLQNRAGRRLAGNLPPMEPTRTWQDVTLPRLSPVDGRPIHIRARGVILSPDDVYLVVGRDAHRLREIRTLMLDAFGWSLAATLVLGVLGGVTMSAGMLRRIDAINRTSARIIEGDLTRRMPLSGSDDEFDRLSQNLNAMLDRIEALMLGLRQVTNDIAHDLRTPLSRLRQRLEAARATARSAEEFDTAVEAAITETDAILETFSALLRIARLEAGAQRGNIVELSLSDIFTTVVELYAPVADDRGRLLTSRIEPEVRFAGDRQLLTQMLVNLVENALDHSPGGRMIDIRLAMDARGPVGVVADDGPGIPPAERERVFRRFYRLDRSRSRPGSGLGLSLVAAIAQLHGIQVDLVDNRPGLAVVLRFPGGAVGEAMPVQAASPRN
jgi:Signal transduction histidine kinase